MARWRCWRWGGTVAAEDLDANETGRERERSTATRQRRRRPAVAVGVVWSVVVVVVKEQGSAARGASQTSKRAWQSQREREGQRDAGRSGSAAGQGRKCNHVDGCAAAAACSGQACRLYVGANSRQEAGSRHDRRLQPCVGEALDLLFQLCQLPRRGKSRRGRARRGNSPWARNGKGARCRRERAHERSASRVRVQQQLAGATGETGKGRRTHTAGRQTCTCEDATPTERGATQHHASRAERHARSRNAKFPEILHSRWAQLECPTRDSTRGWWPSFALPLSVMLRSCRCC